MSDELKHVHETHLAVDTVELSPPHAPRTETPAFRKTRTFLLETKGQGCAICGVTLATLNDPTKNPFGAKSLEAHHHPVEFSLMDAVDIMRIHADYPEVIDRETLAAFIDSPRNMLVLCDQHHRAVDKGIHHVLSPDFWVQKYLISGYQLVAKANDAAAVEAHDDAIEQAAGLEQKEGQAA